MTTISYHSFGPATNRAYFGLLEDVVRRHASAADVEVVLEPTPGSSLGAKQSPSLHPLDVAVLTSRVWHAERAGADVAVVGNIQDPGLAECRGLVAIPVVGLLESALLATRPLGRSVAFVCTHRRVEPLLRARVATYGMGDRLHGFGFLDADLAGLSQAMTDGDRAAMDAVAARVGELAAQLRAAGAEVVVTGSGLLDVLLQSHGGAVEVLSPIAAAFGAAIAAADLHRAGVRTGAREPLDPAEVERYMARVDALIAMERASGEP